MHHATPVVQTRASREVNTAAGEEHRHASPLCGGSEVWLYRRKSQLQYIRDSSVIHTSSCHRGSTHEDPKGIDRKQAADRHVSFVEHLGDSNDVQIHQ